MINLMGYIMQKKNLKYLCYNQICGILVMLTLLLKKRLLFIKQVWHAPFTSYISNSCNTLIDNAEDLYIVIPMHNLTENNKNCSTCYRGEPSDPITNSKYFQFKASITGSKPNLLEI